MFPEKFLAYALYLARYWGRALLYILTGIILVVIGGPSNWRNAQLMCFIIGIMMFAVGCIYLLIAIFSCCNWHPVSLCRRSGKETYEYDRGY